MLVKLKVTLHLDVKLHNPVIVVITVIVVTLCLCLYILWLQSNDGFNGELIYVMGGGGVGLTKC